MTPSKRVATRGSFTKGDARAKDANRKSHPAVTRRVARVVRPVYAVPPSPETVWVKRGSLRSRER